MRGLIVLVLLLCWASPAFSANPLGEGVRLVRHAAEVAENRGGGHALDSGPIDIEATSEVNEAKTYPCAPGAGVLAYYGCQAKTLFSGSIEAIALPLIALLLLLTISTILLWIYTRKVANAARLAAEYVPAVERAYVFGGPTDLFLLHDQASVRLAMQNFGKTPAIIRGWLVEFVAQEPRGKKPTYDETRRTESNEILEPDKLFSPAMTFRSEIAAPFFIVGYIAYEDVFRKQHVTRFCVGVTRDAKAAYAGHPAWNAYD
ncbi:MAG TPA: hypothetical protein VNJ31_05165 [Methyloceanibacter sp.]|nr:hypothetical protein [Methyloceanibacter sp.]